MWSLLKKVSKRCCLWPVPVALTETLAPITTSAPSTQPFAEQTELASTNMGATGKPWSRDKLYVYLCCFFMPVCQTKSYKNDFLFQMQLSTWIPSGRVHWYLRRCRRMWVRYGHKRNNIPLTFQFSFIKKSLINPPNSAGGYTGTVWWVYHWFYRQQKK